jgi:hypothetical protein
MGRSPLTTKEERNQYSYRSPTGEPTYGEIRTCGSGKRGWETAHHLLRWVTRKSQTRLPSTPPKGNPWIESLWGRTKAEIGSRITEASSLPALRTVFDERFICYNQERRHSSIGYVPPREHLGQTLDTLEPELQIANAS